MNIEQTGMSDSIKNLAVAQANVQKEIEDIAKDSEGYGYNYTSYDALVKHLRPLLTKHGISFIQMPVGHDNQIGVRTVYMHTSGEWISSVVLSPIVESRQMNVYQSVGSAITYFRRYSLSAFVGIASDEDNDASTVQVKPKQKQATEKKPEKKVNAKPVSQTDEVILHGMLKELNDSKTSAQVKEGLETGSLNADNVENTKKWLENLIANNSKLTAEEIDEVFGG